MMLMMNCSMFWGQLIRNSTFEGLVWAVTGLGEGVGVKGLGAFMLVGCYGEVENERRIS